MTTSHINSKTDKMDQLISIGIPSRAIKLDLHKKQSGIWWLNFVEPLDGGRQFPVFNKKRKTIVTRKGYSQCMILEFSNGIVTIKMTT